MNQSNEAIHLFPLYIKKHKIVPSENEYNQLDSYLSRLFSESTVDTWALETGKSTGQFDLYLYRRHEIQWLINHAMMHVYTFWQELDYRKAHNIKISSCWANLHKFSQTTGEHSHCGGAIRAHISAVYYFKKPVNSGNIEFVDPLEYIHKMTPRHQYDELCKSMYSQVIADQFDLLLFPSWLKHRTQPSRSYDDRVAISMNFIGQWDED